MPILPLHNVLASLDSALFAAEILFLILTHLSHAVLANHLLALISPSAQAILPVVLVIIQIHLQVALLM